MLLLFFGYQDAVGVYKLANLSAIKRLHGEWLDLDQYRRQEGEAPREYAYDPQMSPRFRQLYSKFGYIFMNGFPHLVNGSHS